MQVPFWHQDGNGKAMVPLSALLFYGRSVLTFELLGILSEWPPEGLLAHQQSVCSVWRTGHGSVSSLGSGTPSWLISPPKHTGSV